MKYDLNKQPYYKLFKSYMDGNIFFVCDLESIRLFPILEQVLKLKKYDNRIIKFDSAEFGTFDFNTGIWLYDIPIELCLKTGLFWKHDYYVKRVGKEWGVFNLSGDLLGEGKEFCITFNSSLSMRYSDFLTKMDEWRHDKNFLE